MIKLTAARRTNTKALFKATADTGQELVDKINSLLGWARAHSEFLMVTVCYPSGEVTSVPLDGTTKRAPLGWEMPR